MFNKCAFVPTDVLLTPLTLDMLAYAPTLVFHEISVSREEQIPNAELFEPLVFF